MVGTSREGLESRSIGAKPVPVLLMVHNLESPRGGTERQVDEIARSLDRSIFEPHVAAMRFDPALVAEWKAAGIGTLQLPVRAFLSPSFLLGLKRFRDYVREHSIRLVHAFDPSSAVFVCAAKAVVRIPRLLSSQRAHRDLSPAHYRPFLRICDRLVHGVVVNCEALRRHLIEEEHVPPGRIRVCYNAIDTARFAPSVRPRSPVVTIGTACVLRREKDLSTLLRAFADLHATHPATTLLMVGTGPEGAALKQLSRDLGIADSCTFVPFQKQIEEYLRRIDVFVLPSLSEALSNSLMEAMACGCCSVATRVGGMPELISPPKTGFLFDPGNAAQLAETLRWLVENPEERERVARAGSDYIHRGFSRARSMAAMAETYLCYLRETD